MKGFVSSRLHPLVNLILLVGIMLAAFCVAGFFIMVIGHLVFGLGALELGNVTQNPAAYEQGWAFTMLSQGVLLFVGFGCSALALAAATGNSLPQYFAPRRPVPLWWLLAAGLLILGTIPFMSGLIDWNAHAHFPSFLKNFEANARAMEDKAQELTKYLTSFTSFTRFLVGLLVIAVVPAISEELVFRGVIQRNLVQWFGSRHLGIWAAATVFSAIHFQFFGFVPRLVLGVLLGYLYEWSGNILVPMAAHFTQNAFQLLLLYLQQRHVANTFNPDSTESLPWPLVLGSVLLTALLLRGLHRWLAVPVASDEVRIPTEMHTLSSGGAAVAKPDSYVPSTGRTLGRAGVDGSHQDSTR
ncbi:CPBP family intramembrane glutamic endopeptidase [Hymenobacter crusticola]|uniref:CAAX prenyl protease 2/Lysostaphin resistance protein A-like domain-containing protein n=1 Tax=Hymenobacter crusticola TaxID=1770526 RepID=A0A243WCV8_9BACT|nr:CPBP family intramembrane glutamic endopeptidase [Hymenobacter crusticola]OUJ73478.1 hypothetical protein BXP70_13800 [Hymenobacter crusticola]